MKIKICGITNIEDALMCVDEGADALGFIFYSKSPRKVLVQTAKEIIKSLPCFVHTVGVFVDEDKEDVAAIASEVGLDVLQFHGDESPEYCEAFMPRYKVVKVFFPKDETIVTEMRKYNVTGQLIDVPFDLKQRKPEEVLELDLIKPILEEFKSCIFSGGITVDNIDEVLDKLNPYAIDIARGTEKEPGIKDRDLISKLIKKIKEK